MDKTERTGGITLLLGVVIGLILGLAVRDIWPPVPLYASATQGQENYAIATGLVDERVEAIYFLDFLTGNLQAAVINPKTGKFNSLFRRNVSADFGQGGSKNPKYLMVTGLVDMPRGRSNVQAAKSIVYISDASTGQTVAYTFPWNQSAHVAGRPQSAGFEPLDRVDFRTMPIRDE